MWAQFCQIFLFFREMENSNFYIKMFFSLIFIYSYDRVAVTANPHSKKKFLNWVNMFLGACLK